MKPAPPKFACTPLFDSYKEFYSIERGNLFPSCTPSIEGAIIAAKENVPVAIEDYRHVKEFLRSKCRRSEATYNAFRSETERFLLWAWCVHGKSIAKLKKRDIEAYLDFVASPPESWIGIKISPRFSIKNGQKHPNKEWRPFVAKLSKAERTLMIESGVPVKKAVPDIKSYKPSQKSFTEVFSNLSALYNHLVEEDYAYGNCLAAVRKSSPHLITDDSGGTTKRLSDLQWEYVLETARALAEGSPAWERNLFIVASLKSLYLRVSELSYRPTWTPTMGDFAQDLDGNWWFNAFGKGNKKRKVSVPDDYLPYLQRYRLSRGLHGLPSVGETTPLLQPIRQHRAGLQVRAISHLTQAIFDRASESLEKDGFTDDARVLKATSTHWLRHTGASMDVKSRSLKDLSADLGHGQISTTDKIYVHSDDAERAASGRKRRV